MCDESAQLLNCCGLTCLLVGAIPEFSFFLLGPPSVVGVRTVGDHRVTRGQLKLTMDNYKPLGEGPVNFTRGSILFQSGNAHKVQRLQI